MNDAAFSVPKSIKRIKKEKGKLVANAKNQEQKPIRLFVI